MRVATCATMTAIGALALAVGLGGCSNPNGAGNKARPAGEGKAMVTATQHPFLFFSTADVPRMREEAGSTHRTYYDLLAAWGREFLAAEPIVADRLPTDRDVLQVYYENAAACVINMALLWHLSGEQQYYDAAETWLSAFCTYPVETDGGYFIGSYALGLAAGYDMLYPWLDEAARTRARDHLAAVLDRGVKGTTEDWWAFLRVHHDHWLPAAGLCIAAAAVAGETPGGQERLTFLSDHFDRAMKAVGEDGAWTEGASQWTYAMAMSYIWFDVAKRLTGRDLFQTPMARGNVPYRLYNRLPDGRYVFHHDSFSHGRYNIMGSASAHLLRKLAAELRSPQAQWLADRDEPRDMKLLTDGLHAKADWLTSRENLVPSAHGVAWNFLWYDPSVKAEAPGAMPRQRVFDNQGLVIARSGWGPTDTVLTFTCAPLGGHQARAEVLAGDERLAANMGHIHARAGAFGLFAGGNYLVVPPGYGGVASSANSTLTIEGADQQRHPKHDARIRRLDLADDHTYVAAEMAACYPADANLVRWTRHLAWLTPDLVVIADDLAARGPSARGRKTVWRMNFDNENNDVTVDGQSCRVTPRPPEGKAALAVHLLEPRGMEMKAAELRLPNATWAMCGQVQAAVTDIFRDSSRARIVATLEVLGSAEASAGLATLVEGPHATGAAVEKGDWTRAAIFVTNDEKDALPLTFTLTGGKNLRCLVFGLPAQTGCTAEVRRHADDGRTTYTVTVRKGGSLMTSKAGALTVISPVGG